MSAAPVCGALSLSVSLIAQLQMGTSKPPNLGYIIKSIRMRNAPTIRDDGYNHSFDLRFDSFAPV